MVLQRYATFVPTFGAFATTCQLRPAAKVTETRLIWTTYWRARLAGIETRCFFLFLVWSEIQHTLEVGPESETVIAFAVDTSEVSSSSILSNQSNIRYKLATFRIWCLPGSFPLIRWSWRAALIYVIMGRQPRSAHRDPPSLFPIQTGIRISLPESINPSQPHW